MSSKIAKRQLREMGAVLAAPQMGSTGGKSSKKSVAFAPSKGVFAAPNIKSVKGKGGVQQSGGKKLSKSTAKRRRQKAFPLNFGARPRADEKERRLKSNVERKLAADRPRPANAAALKVLKMRAGATYKAEPDAHKHASSADDDSDLDDLIDDLM
mmetsp:Transcript_60892/g.98594  ORF Transcript_60892/g.98594 Transcript_60892/m.98594 type:complete len:155 (+) Transcript_60892:42-506(+)